MLRLPSSVVFVTAVAFLLGWPMPARGSPGEGLRDVDPPLAEPSFVPGELLAKFSPGTAASQVQQILSQCSLRVFMDSNSMLSAAARAPSHPPLPSQLTRLARNVFWLRTLSPRTSLTAALSCLSLRREVVFAQRNTTAPPDAHRADHYPNDPQFIAGNQWGLLNAGQNDPAGARTTIDADVDVVQAWDLPHRDCSSIVVAVFDTGADLLHPDLAANLWRNPGEIPGNGLDDDGNLFADDVFGFDFTEAALNPFTPAFVDLGGDGPQDTLPAGARFGGHGTAVAGIIGAVGNNGLDIAGICWQARLMILRVGNPVFNQGAILFAALYVALQKLAFGQDVRVINMSGSSPANSPALTLAANLITAADVLFVVTPGNLGANNDARGPGLPGRFPCSLPNANILCVAASTSRDELAGFSNFGTTSVDLAAPGEHIVTLRRGVDGGGATPLPGLNGTSFAAPFVSGIAALAFSLFPAKTPASVRSDILGGAIGPPAASGVDRVKGRALTARSIVPRVASGGRLRWPYTGDLGDAPPSYLTVATPVGGALHWDIGNEFLGADATPEVDAVTPPPFDQDPLANLVDQDIADEPVGPGNGRFVFAPPPPWAPGAAVTVAYSLCSDSLRILDADGGRYQGGNPDRTLYVNAWFDLNRNGLFEPAELLLQDVISPPPPPAPPAAPGYPNVTINLLPVLPPPVMAPVFPPPTVCRRIVSQFVVPRPGGTPAWIRFRLDYGEDAGLNNPAPLFRPDPTFGLFGHLHWARYGEVEDFRPPEVDRFPCSQFSFVLLGPHGPETVHVQGPTTMQVGVGPAGEARDLDRNGRDEVPVEIVDLELTGHFSLGPLTLRLHQPTDALAGSPGRIEETSDTQPGRLDLPPFVPSGSAESSIDLQLEIEAAGATFHTAVPIRLTGRITHKPPAPGESYSGTGATPLLNQVGLPTGYAVGSAQHTPDPGTCTVATAGASRPHAAWREDL